MNFGSGDFITANTHTRTQSHARTQNDQHIIIFSRTDTHTHLTHTRTQMLNISSFVGFASIHHAGVSPVYATVIFYLYTVNTSDFELTMCVCVCVKVYIWWRRLAPNNPKIKWKKSYKKNEIHKCMIYL